MCPQSEIEEAMRYLNPESNFLFMIGQLPIELNPLSQSMEQFNHKIETGTKLTSSFNTEE